MSQCGDVRGWICMASREVDRVRKCERFNVDDLRGGRGT